MKALPNLPIISAQEAIQLGRTAIEENDAHSILEATVRSLYKTVAPFVRRKHKRAPLIYQAFEEAIISIIGALKWSTSTEMPHAFEIGLLEKNEPIGVEKSDLMKALVKAGLARLVRAGHTGMRPNAWVLSGEVPWLRPLANALGLRPIYWEEPVIEDA